MTTDKGSIVHGAFLIPEWQDDPQPIERGAFHQRDGRVVEIGTFQDLCRKYPDAYRWGGEDLVVMPGFVNAHAHGRGLSTYQMGQPDEPLESRIVEMSFRSEWGAAGGQSPEDGNRGYDPYLDTLLACLKQIASGITTVVHSHIYLDGPVEDYARLTRKMLSAYRDSGIRCSFALGIRDRFTYTFMDDDAFLASLPKELSSGGGIRPIRYEMRFDEFHSLLVQLAREFPDITFQMGPWNPVWCSERLMGEMGSVSANEGIRIHTHLMETRYQARYAERTFGKSWVSVLDQLGVLSPRFSGAHSVWLSSADMKIMKERGCQVIYNPSSNMRLGSGIAPAREFLKNGIPVAFGLDSLAMNDDEDMFQDLRLGQQIQNGPGIDRKSIPATQMFAMATRCGALVSGIEGVGTLRPGGAADAVLISLPLLSEGLRNQPLPDQMLRRAKASHVQGVMIGGDVLLHDGVSRKQDLRGLLDQVVGTVSGRQRTTDPMAAEVKEHVRTFLRTFD